MVQQTLGRHRLSPEALASRLGVAVADLGGQTLEKGLSQQVEALSKAQPKPLVAVDDVLKAGGLQLRGNLIKDARQLANKVLALYQRYAYMNEQHETHLTALNHLRLYVYGNAEDKGHDYLVPEKVWQAVRPVEALLESWVAANNYAAQADVYSELLGAYAQLTHLRNTRLPSFEEDLGTLTAVHTILEDFDQKYATLVKEVEAYNTWREHLETTAPLTFDGQGQDLSLSAQMPREARAQAMAEEALATLKASQQASQQADRKALHQKGKRREQEVIDSHFHKLLAALEAGDEPDVPTITAAELDPEKAADSSPKESPAASLKQVVAVPVPKAPRVKQVKEEQDEELTAEPGEELKAAPKAGTAPSTQATTGAPAPQPIAAPPVEAKAQAPETDSEVDSEVDSGTDPKAGLYKDTGLRQPGWQNVHEEMLRRHYLNKNQGYFSSKDVFAAIQRNIMVICHAQEMGMNEKGLKQLFKTLRWGSEKDDPPPPA